MTASNADGSVSVQGQREVARVCVCVPKAGQQSGKSHSEVNVLTDETARGSSGTATLEAAAVDYGSAACGRKNI